MKPLILLAASFALNAETICGAKPSNAYVDYAEVACVDFDALAKLSPIFSGKGKETQVLIHAKRGDAVAVTVDGETKYAALNKDAYGRLVAMATFAGIEHKEVSVKVLSEER